MTRTNDRLLVAREYATLDRVSRRRLNATGWLRGVNEPIDSALAEVARLRPRRVLDAGCGDGYFASLVAAPEVFAVDSSAAAVAAARERGVDAREADIEALPFADGQFDVVTCNWVLYHLPDLDRGLRELARVLRPGGRFVGVYNLRDHMAELWRAVGDPWSPDDFDGENGAAALERHFARVTRIDTRGEVLWESREDLQSYLDAYIELVGELSAPPGPYPFRATRRNCVLVAEKA